MKQTTSMSITNKVKGFAIENGACLVGIAPISRFQGAPLGHHPKDFLPDCQSVIVIASRILDRGLDHPKLIPNGSEFIKDDHLRRIMQDYFWEIESHGPTSDLLSMLGMRIAMILQDEGHGSIYFRSSDSDFYGQGYLGNGIIPNHSIFSHKHAAVRAGLGEFGLDSVVVTPEYGQRVRFNTILTVAELNYTPLLKEKVCLGKKCGLCLENCERFGVIKLKSNIDENKVWLNPVSIVNKDLCRQTSAINYCKGQCIGNCPIGERV